ncbi:MAG: hypothetical protein MUF28_11270 [Ignavibacterium sp.]|jgi:hypothetical protein|nr:hypothetical protein [Ignavibacterium sp.]
MEKALSIIDFKSNIKTYLIDFFLLLMIYFLPAISHLFAFPVYYLDPMRIALVIALVHTSKKNAYIIALTLPLFSFLISSHPQIIKSFLLSAELVINLSLFFLLKDKLKNVFTSLFLSIVISKVIYYSLKFALISLTLLNDRLFSTPLYFQLMSAVLLSTYIYLVNRTSTK